MIDDDDLSLDQSTTTTWYNDGDQDGFGDPTNTLNACNEPNNFVSNSTDCDDNTDTVNPNAVEVCDNTDNDCNGAIDDDATDVWFGIR